jgi:hypothetical protein
MSVAVAILGLIGTVLLPRESDFTGRVGVSALGVTLVTIGVARPAFAWKYDKGMRSVIGDRAFSLYYIIIGLIAAFGVWF